MLATWIGVVVARCRAVVTALFGTRERTANTSGSDIVDIDELQSLVPADESALLDLFKRELLQVRLVSKHFRKIDVLIMKLQHCDADFNVAMTTGSEHTDICTLKRGPNTSVLVAVVGGQVELGFDRTNVKDVAKIVLNAGANKRWLAYLLYKANGRNA